MQYNRPWEESGYDRRARERNPLQNNSIKGSSDLESSVNDASIGSDYSNNGFIRQAGRGFSLLLATYMLLITACGGQATPIPSPTSIAQRAISTPATRQERFTPQSNLEARVVATATSIPTQPQIIVPIDKPTYRVIFPFKEPSNTIERAILKTTDEVTYMKFIRFRENIKWAISFADLINQTWSPSKWRDFFKRNQELGKLIPYVPLEDITRYQQSRPSYRGTYVEAKPVYFQQTATRGLIPIENPDIDGGLFEELRKKYSNPFIALALSEGLSEDIVSKLYIFSKDGSLEDIDKRIIAVLVGSHPEVRRVLSDQLMEKGSTPFGRVPASFNYSRSDIETLDSILKPLEEMKGMPFVEGKNVLFFYRSPITVDGVKINTKDLLDRYEVVKVMDLIHQVQVELTGYSPFGDQKVLISHSVNPWYPTAQPIRYNLEGNYKMRKDFFFLLFSMTDQNVPRLLYGQLSRPIDAYHLTGDTITFLLFTHSLDKAINEYGNEISAEARNHFTEMSSKFNSGFRESFEKTFASNSHPGTFGGIEAIRKVAEDSGEDIYKNFFHIWTYAESYAESNPKSINGMSIHEFLTKDNNGNSIQDYRLVVDTLIISALCAASDKDSKPQFSEYKIDVHQGLFDKTLPFFRCVLDYSRNTQK